MQNTSATDSRKRSLLYGFYVSVNYRRRYVDYNVAEEHRLSNGVFEANLLIFRPAREYRGSDDSYALGNYNLLDTRAEHECFGTDTDKTVGKFYFFQSRALTEELFADIAERLGQFYVYESRASVEYVTGISAENRLVFVTYGLYTFGKFNRLQRRDKTKGIRSEISYVLGNINGFQSGKFERLLLDSRQGLRQIDVSQSYAEIERSVTD